MGTKTGDAKSAIVMRLYGLAQMLAQAETEVLRENNAAAIERLQELETHTARLINMLSPSQSRVLAAVA
jgi:hypothetical protein